MHTAARSIFTTVKTEGAILPGDLLQRIAEGRGMDGLRPEDYHLAPHERLNEAINRAWNRCLGAWLAFHDQRQRLPESDAGTTLTRERWLLILFQELGYGRLQLARGLEVDGTTYPISHAWGDVPIHLVTFRQDLDRRGELPGTAKRSPHSMVQEYLNRSETALWGMTSNGLRLRLLRDNASLTRAAYVEFDLEAMLRGELYADFALLWLVCHQSRLEGLGTLRGEWGVGSGDKPKPTPHSPLPTPLDCWLERWSKTATEQGTRALDALRDGVQEAIAALGRGFLAHPANRELKARLRAGELTQADYYRQLLRLVYRLIFLFVSEERELLLVPEADTATRRRYEEHYSVRRLRRLAGTLRGGPHADLYRGLRLVLTLLRDGYSPLGLPALGGYLFSARATPDLDTADLANSALLEAVRALAFTTEGNVRRPVDYRNLGSEEMGSVYESLLELHPRLNVDVGTFDLQAAAGSERKTTGSYYTPTSLINCLLDSALEPVVAERLQGIGSGEWGRGKGRSHVGTGDSVVPGSQSVAGRHGSGASVLRGDQSISPGRGLRDDVADSTGSGIHSGQHRGGQRSGEPGRVYPVSAHRLGFTQGIGDPPAPLRTSWPDDQQRHAADPGSVRVGGQDAARPDSLAAGETADGKWGVGNTEGGVGNREWGVGNRTHEPTPYSPLPTPRAASPAETAILSIKVVDPACGSGHFLIAAAHRLARHLARLRTGDEEPAPAQLRAALRDVVRHCIHGVDLNEMAVELCKVGLWLETLDPGKPLSFLERNIQCGNSLIGATPALLKAGVPDEAFTPIEGDDKAVCSEYRKRNKLEKRQRAMFAGDLQPWQKLGDLAASVAALDSLADDTIEAVHCQETTYAALVRSSDYVYNRLWADAWCAAFVWKKTKEFPYPITEEVFRQIERNPFGIPPWLRDEIARLAGQYGFFHWHLAFPHVFGSGAEEPTYNSPLTTPERGFDVVLGNPPWEKLQTEETQFFAGRAPDIASLVGAERKRTIGRLRSTDAALADRWEEHRRSDAGAIAFVRNCGVLPLTAMGKFNSYALFAETGRRILSPSGRMGVIVPTGIATDDTTKLFFRDLMDAHVLVSLYDFENRAKLFPAIDSRMKFSLVTLTGPKQPAVVGAEFVFFAHSVDDLRDPDRHFKLGVADIALLNPNTRTCPIFRSRRDAELTRAIYSYVPVFLDESRTPQGGYRPDVWRLLNLTDDSSEFCGFQQGRERKLIPVVEAKTVHQFDHRFAQLSASGGESSSYEPVTVDQKAKRDFEPRYRYYVTDDCFCERVPQRLVARGWFLTVRKITNATNERTVIASVIPRAAGCQHTPYIEIAGDAVASAFLLGALNSFVLDYVARQKVGGTDLSNFMLYQFPIVDVRTTEPSVREFCVRRVLELVHTSDSVRSFARDCGYDGPPFRWDEARRFLLRCELDALYFHLYGIAREDVDYIMDTFPIVRRKDEEKHGEYRTKRVILEVYDETQQARAGGLPYQTRLDPPPADPRVAHSRRDH